MIFFASNNEAEYEPILAKLDPVLALATDRLRICSDSQLVVAHIKKEYEVKDEHMAHYLALVQIGLAKLSEWNVEKAPQTKNSKANTLVGITAILPIKEVMLLPVYLQTMFSIATTSICSTIESDIGWMNDIMKYLRTGELPEEDKQVHKIRVQAARFTLIGDNLYNRSFGGPYLKCSSNPEAQYVLAELHEGVYDNHVGEHTLAHHTHS